MNVSLYNQCMTHTPLKKRGLCKSVDKVYNHGKPDGLYFYKAG